MEHAFKHYGKRRIYDTKPNHDASIALNLKDKTIDLGEREFELYKKVCEWLPSNRDLASLSNDTGLNTDAIGRLFKALESHGLLYRYDQIKGPITGLEFHSEYFSKVLPSWLSEAFSHPFWQRMNTGKGSARLFSGWLIELYHYTRNANRHMPLSCAQTLEKPIKTLRAKHYAEEWNHYHFFMKSLKALGFTESEIRDSVPLPTTLALSNFMRQAAREDILCYSICSAVLEGTTTDRSQYNPYYEKSAQLYNIPSEAIVPIYAHLDLDVKYGHSDLFLEILTHVDVLTPERAGRIFEYGHQLVELIWLWTENIEKYYEDEKNPVPRQQFDPIFD